MRVPLPGSACPKGAAGWLPLVLSTFAVLGTARSFGAVDLDRRPRHLPPRPRQRGRGSAAAAWSPDPVALDRDPLP